MRNLLILTLLPVCAWAQPDEFRARREALRKELDGVTVLFGRSEKDVEDARTAFFQEPNFFYLTGWREPDAILVLTTQPPLEILFLPRRDAEREKWTGRKAAPDDPDIRQRTGFDTVLPTESFEAQLLKLIEGSARVNALLDQPTAAKLKALLSFREIGDAQPAIARLRMKKSASELARIQKSIDATIDGFRAAWKRLAAGLYEYQVATTLSGVYFERGCGRHAYAPIIGAGPNALVLHYADNTRRMDAGELLLMDAGAECDGYAADITRTVPVNGRFSGRQHELYNIVLGAQKATIAAVKPGMMLRKGAPNSLYQVALDYFDSHCKDRQGNSLGRYFTHGISHHLGLDVHDASDLGQPLAPGMVITVEPGLYIPEEGIGIRIEDVVLVTEHGAKVLSDALPREAADIEKALKK